MHVKLVYLCAVSVLFIRLTAIAENARGPAPSAETDRLSTAVEALTRVQNINLDQNPKLKETVSKLLEKTRGTPNFVKLVQKFKLQDQNAGLLEVVLANPASDLAAEAIKLLGASDDVALLRGGLEHTNVAAAIKFAEVLGGTGNDKHARLLQPLLCDSLRDPAVRKQAVRSLAQTLRGAEAILRLTKSDQLPEELRFTASSELNRARWPEIRAEAAKVLPPLQVQNAEPLPPLAELMKRTGNAGNGAQVFNHAAAACATCHRVNGQGVEFGPDLSEIGTKLGKEALYESILDPSAGVSFGYEAWQIRLESGDEVFGLLASETADEIAIKIPGGIVTRHRKSDVKERQKMKLSIMPAGLQQGLTTQELVDLVEYLASLKKR